MKNTCLHCIVFHSRFQGTSYKKLPVSLYLLYFLFCCLSKVLIKGQSGVLVVRQWGIPKVPKIASLQHLSNVSEVMDKFDFCYILKLNIKILYKLVISSILLTIARHTQSTQDNKFAIFQEGGYELDFLYADNHQILIQVGTIKFGWLGHSCLISQERSEG